MWFCSSPIVPAGVLVPSLTELPDPFPQLRDPISSLALTPFQGLLSPPPPYCAPGPVLLDSSSPYILLLPSWVPFTLSSISLLSGGLPPPFKKLLVLPPSTPSPLFLPWAPPSQLSPSLFRSAISWVPSPGPVVVPGGGGAGMETASVCWL